MTSDRRLAALVVVSLALHVLALGWLTRPIALPLSLPTLEVLLVSAQQAPTSAPQTLDSSEQPGSKSSEPPERDLARTPRDAASSAAASDRRLSRLGPTPEPKPAASEVLAEPQPTIDRSRALTPPDPSRHPAVAGAPASSRPAPNAGVMLAIRQQLARYQAYPPSARRRGLEGAATVRFVITRSGDLLDSELLQSSGSRHLDQAALKLVSDAAPYPPLPATITAVRLEVKIPIEYRLNPPAT